MTNTGTRRYDEFIPAAIATLGVVLYAVDVVASVSLLGLQDVWTPAVIVGRLVGLAFCAGIVVVGVRLHRSDLAVTRYRRIAAWIVGSTVGFVAINVLLVVFIPLDSLYGNVAWILFAAYVGVAGGLVVGTVEARAIDRAVEAERKALQAEHAEAQRKWFDYLNSLLRHEVLNNASIIQGYASLLLDEADLSETPRQQVETIQRQSRDMSDVIRDVRVLVQAADRTDAFRTVDVAAVLAEELEDLRATYADVETDLSVDGDAHVRGDHLLARIFSNLLSNAVEHDPSESTRVTVTVTTTPENVRVDVADDGPGVPDADRKTLFERGQGDHGFGLYLVSVLADRYGGSVELTETGSAGSVFTAELPRTDPSTTEATPDVGSDGRAETGAVD